MNIKCPKCGRIQEVSEDAWRITREGLSTGLPGKLGMVGVHPFTCCDHEDMVVA